MLPNSRTRDLVLQNTGDELLVYDLITNRAICLNHTSVMVWQMCDGKKSFSDLAKELESQFSATRRKTCEVCSGTTKRVDLLQDQEQFSDKYEGLSRREVIRGIGLGISGGISGLEKTGVKNYKPLALFT